MIVHFIKIGNVICQKIFLALRSNSRNEIEMWVCIQIFIDLNTCLLFNLKTLSQLSQKIRKHVFDVKCYSDSCVNFPILLALNWFKKAYLFLYQCTFKHHYISISFKALVKLLKRKIKTVIMELIDSGLRFCLYFHDFHLFIINFAAFKQLFKNLE